MKILVLAGGHSAERDISLQSGRCVADALANSGHNVETIDPATTRIDFLNANHWEIAIPMVHGTGGEDGVLQKSLDTIGLKYVGSSATASELTFNKIRTNSLLKAHGLAVANSVIVKCQQSPADQRIDVLSLGLPVVTKPPRQGSSVGINIVTTEDQIQAALLSAFEYDELCLVESFIDGREITVPVIDGRPFPAIEIRPAEAWYDYEAKYKDDRTEYIVAPDNVSTSISDLAVAACEICNVTGIARVDFRIDRDSKPYILEINTIPGMTSHSLVPKSAAYVQLSMSDVCELAIRNRLKMTGE